MKTQNELGQYRLIERLGAGGMGEVFLARLEREEGFKKLLVVKRILPELSESARFREMFSTEARIAANLNHPHIIQVTDFGRIERNCFLAMEYIAGTDLASLLDRASQKHNTIGVDFIIGVGLACLRGLDYAHRSNPSVVHGDVNPSNILVGREGEVKLADFGLASLSGKRSQNHQIQGKLCYMPPEVAFGQAAQPASDIFGLGATLYEMLTGVSPLPRVPGFEDALEQARRCMIPPVMQIQPEVNPALANIINRALAPAAEDRFENAQVMENSLLRIVESLNLDPGPRTIGNFVSSIVGTDRRQGAPNVPRTLVALPAAKSGNGLKNFWLVFIMLAAISTGGTAWYFLRADPKNTPEPDGPLLTESEPIPNEPDGGKSAEHIDAGTMPPPDAGKKFAGAHRLGLRRKVKSKITIPRRDGGLAPKDSGPEHPASDGRLASNSPKFSLKTNRPVFIYLDNKPKQNAPLVLPDGLKGTHILKIKDGRGLTAVVRIEAEGIKGDIRFAFRSTPFAILSVDGSPRGLTPIGQIRLSRGAHVFSLAIPKHKPLVLRMNIN
ncbi:MAG: serine/threonine protein kinase [Deltaproteobacteria bacterium]|nr:serine/threonine protein kinase [Deltaproteobacteria bacterium]